MTSDPDSIRRDAEEPAVDAAVAAALRSLPVLPPGQDFWIDLERRLADTPQSAPRPDQAPVAPGPADQPSSDGGLASVVPSRPHRSRWKPIQGRVARLPLTGPEDDLSEAIMTTATTGAVTAEASRLHPRRWLVAVAAAIALVFEFAAVQPGQGGRSTVWATEIVAIAEAAPRLLVDRPGWTVARADQFAADQAEMTFSNGRQELELRWIPVGEHADRLKDRASGADLRGRHHCRRAGGGGVPLRGHLRLRSPVGTG